MKIKICGLTSTKEAQYLNENKVDYAGMVLFFPKSKRNITIEQAKTIMEALEPTIKKVAVVVSPTLEQAKEICRAGFDVIQIHGTLTDEVYEEISIDIWKAFNVKDIGNYQEFKNHHKINGFVFDSVEPGSGKAYNHSLLENIERVDGKLFILAGGLNQENVGKAICDVKPDVVDVSSGVEYVDRLGKDKDKIDNFVVNARKTNF